MIVLLTSIALALAADAAPEKSSGLSGPLGMREHDWRRAHVSRAISLRYSPRFNFDGAAWMISGESGSVVRISGRDCLEGELFAFDVDDRLSADARRPLSLELALQHPAGSTVFVAHFQRNGGAAVITSDGDGWRRPDAGLHSVSLNDARLANEGLYNTDIIIGIRNELVADATNPSRRMVLCDLSIRGASDFAEEVPSGRLKLSVTDPEASAPAPVRISIFDLSGNAPLPSERAVPIRIFDDVKRSIAIVSTPKLSEPWPYASRAVFYISGDYEAVLPAGRYRLAASKGPEFRRAVHDFEIAPGKTTEATIELQRWIDMPSRGWYSGDTHTHVTRAPADNENLARIAAAEDLHALHLLEMGNLGGTFFPQYRFGPSGVYRRNGRILISGEENPRTSFLGHMMALYPRNRVGIDDAYFDYPLWLSTFASENAVTGFAHAGQSWAKSERGAALALREANLQVLEIMQDGLLHLEPWYDYLNLGYRIAPIAGSDFPYIALPGNVRTYVRVQGVFSAESWMSGLRAGRVFVTDGPMLTLRVNGYGVGEEIEASEGAVLAITAEAKISPDLDRLHRLEIVSRGEIIALAQAEFGALSLKATHEMRVGGDTWIAARAYGLGSAKAHSAPVYVRVNGAAPSPDGALRRKLLDPLEELRGADPSIQAEFETWDYRDLLQPAWEMQRESVQQQASEALEYFRALFNDEDARNAE